MSYTVKTPCGVVRGTTCRIPNVAAFKGIRYATAGRWEYPVEVTGWEGVYDASNYGNCCYQLRAFYNEADLPEKAFLYKEFRKGETYTYSEDCLFLNVWTPESALEGGKLPVLVYIHGGSFTGGCGHEKHFDDPVWPRHGVVAVTINYRLGPFGFLCHPELAAEAGHTGNYGLYDQLTALQWVHRNIAAFGGDPEQVTIMGQSAGAMSVQQHCLSPLSEGLFRSAVMSSGAGVHKLLSAAKPDAVYPFWQALMARLGCKTIAQLRGLPAEQLYTAWQCARKEVKGGGLAAFPVLDGKLVVGTGAELLKAGKQRKIPYMAGCTSEDLVPPVLYNMAKDWCAAQPKNSYAWLFDRRLPGDDCGAWHASDLWYWFGTLENCWRPMTEKDYDLSCQMVAYLMNFVKTGNPNGEGLTQWIPASQSGKQVLRFGESEPRMEQVSQRQLVKTMLTTKVVGI